MVKQSFLAEDAPRVMVVCRDGVGKVKVMQLESLCLVELVADMAPVETIIVLMDAFRTSPAWWTCAARPSSSTAWEVKTQQLILPSCSLPAQEVYQR